MEDYFGEIEEIIIRLNENGVYEEFYLGPLETDGKYEKRPGDVRFDGIEHKISFEIDDLSDSEFHENLSNFLGIYGQELASMSTLWGFANFFTMVDEDTNETIMNVTDDYQWTVGSSYLGEHLKDEEKFEKAQELIEACMLLGDQLDFGHILATISEKLIKQRAAYLKLKLIQRETRNTENRRKRKRFGTMEFRKLAERDGFKCAICNTTKELEIDHIIPFSKGGNDDLSNLQLLCRTCNAQKGAKFIM